LVVAAEYIFGLPSVDDVHRDTSSTPIPKPRPTSRMDGAGNTNAVAPSTLPSARRVQKRCMIDNYAVVYVEVGGVRKGDGGRRMRKTRPGLGAEMEASRLLKQGHDLCVYAVHKGWV